MKRKLLLLVCALPLVASDPPGFELWSASDLKNMEHQLSQKMDAAHFSAKQLTKFPTHNFMLAHREGSGSAEWHAKDNDVFVVETGGATLVVGGELVNGKTTAPDEMRGTSIRNGSSHHIGVGDVVNIPAKMPHQLLLNGNDKNITYFVVKIRQ